MFVKRILDYLIKAGAVLIILEPLWMLFPFAGFLWRQRGYAGYYRRRSRFNDVVVTGSLFIADDFYNGCIIYRIGLVQDN